VATLELDETRHRRAEREPLGVARVDAAEERLGHTLERLAAESPADERRDALVALGAPARQHEIEQHAELPVPREERRPREVPEVRRREEREALGDGDESAAAHDVNAPVVGPGADQASLEAESRAQRDGPGLLGDERVGARLDQEAAAPLGRDRSPEPIVRVEQDHLEAAPGLDQTERRGEPGHTTADDRDPFHRAASRTSSASMRTNSGWSFTVGTRTNPRPAARAVAAASTSRS